MTDPATTWQAWKDATFGSGYMIWHDGLDVDAVTRLRGEARERAVDMLRLGLTQGDAHAAQALAAMGEPATRAEILAQLARSSGGSRVRLALAAHALRPDPALAAHLVEVLRSELHWGERIDAAIGLRRFTGDADETALLAAVGDADYLVRYHACESLLARWRVAPADISGHPEIFARICDPDEGAASTNDAARHAEARALLLALRR